MTIALVLYCEAEGCYAQQTLHGVCLTGDCVNNRGGITLDEAVAVGWFIDDEQPDLCPVCARGSRDHD